MYPRRLRTLGCDCGRRSLLHHRGRAPDVLLLNSSGPNGTMNQREDYHETTDSITVSKFDSAQVNHSLGMMKDLSVSTQRLPGGDTPRIHQQLLLQGGNHLRGDNLLRGGRHQVGMNSDFLVIPVSRCFAYRQDFVSKDSGAMTSSENRAEEFLAKWRTRNNQAVSNRVRRETSSKLISVFLEVHKMQKMMIKEE